jgi:pyroglutamyl-peptidase
MPVERTLQTRVTNSRKLSKTLLKPPKLQKTLLLTGFEAFGDDPSGQGLNPSAQVALALNGQSFGSWQIAGAVLPCVFNQAPRELKRLIKQHQPAAIICLGQAGGRSAISLERVAINWDEATLPDNAGQQRTGQPILKTAPAAYFSTLPIHALRDALLAQSIPAELSSSAGHFVCNHVFFHLMHHGRKSKKPAGFIHIPYLPEQVTAGQPSMPLATMIEAIRSAIAHLPS